MIVLDCPQQSPEWFAARAGRPTSSCFDMIITPKTMKPSAQAEKYLYTLAGERLTGCKAESFHSQWMDRGTELEDEARKLFSLVRDVEIRQVGLVYSDERKLYSCSPDGLLESEGLEAKCPAMHTHISYLLGGCLPTEYIAQVQGSMFVTGFMSWWFLSHYPGLPPFMVRVFRDDRFCAALAVELASFCERLDEVEFRLRKLM